MMAFRPHPDATLDLTPVISVRDLTIRFQTPAGMINAVDHVSFDVAKGKVFGLVGESGSGKSVTALSLMRLLPQRPGGMSGQILFEGRDIVTLPERELQRLRGRDVSMVFQEPMTSLNPIATIGRQVAEPLRIHLGLGRRAARERSAELLAMVAIPNPRRVLDLYPHELSGGMRQRVMIAMAIACEPKLIIADEPTTALDVTTQAQILDLLRDLQSRLGMAIIMITHDLGVISEFADDVQVMYAGRAVERARARDLFRHPLHPYTRGLLNSIPDIDARQAQLVGIEGTVPNPLDLPPGCAFAARCQQVQADCLLQRPALMTLAPQHWAACFHPADDPQTVIK